MAFTPAHAGGDWDKVRVTGFEIINPDQSEFKIEVKPDKKEKFSVFPKACTSITIHVSYSKIYSYFNFPDFITFEENTEAAAQLKTAMVEGVSINFGSMGTGLIYDKKNPCIARSKALWRVLNSERKTEAILSLNNPV